MFYKIRQKTRKWRFDLSCRGILSTVPIQVKENQLKILSMLCHPDLIMYLIAIKSLYAHLGMGQIVILNDGTLTSKDIELLNQHLSKPQIVNIHDIEPGKCPKGGCWERLLFISECVKESYVIQLDSDTVTFNEIPEVIDSVRENRSFTLGTHMGRQIVSMEDICKQMKTFEDDHIQVLAEKNFDKLPDFNRLKYVRGCAGFAGFAKGSFSRSKIEDFSKEMENIIGKAWLNWGSEQVASNFIISNSSSAWVLPQPKYSNFTPEIPYEKSSFLHFLGTSRFKKGIYRKIARNMVKRLNLIKPLS